MEKLQDACEGVDIEGDFVLDAALGAVLYRTAEGFAVPCRVTMEDVYDYEGLQVAKKWDDLLEALPTLDGTPFIAHHPTEGQQESHVPIWGRTLKPVANPPYIDSELFVYNTAPAEFQELAESGGHLPVSMGFKGRRYKEDGVLNGKPFSHTDKNIQATHVAYAPPPWTARCKKCAVNPVDAELGDTVGEDTQIDDALIAPADVGTALEELLDIKDDYEFGKTARAVVARIIAGGTNSMSGDAEKDKQAALDAAAKKAAEDAVAAAKKLVEEKKAAEDAAKADPGKPTPAVQPDIAGMLDAALAKHLKPLEEKLAAQDAELKALKDTEKARQDAILAAQDAEDAKAFDALLSEGGKAANVIMDADGKTVKETGVLRKAFAAASSKAAWFADATTKGYIKGPEIEQADAQGNQFIGDIDLTQPAGTKQLSAEWTKKFYPGKAAKGAV